MRNDRSIRRCIPEGVALLVVGQLVVGSLAFAEVVTSLPPAEASRIDAIFKPWNRTDTPGCAVSVARQGEPVYAGGFGMAHLEQPTPITADTIFEAGSVSKQFTAAAVALLAIDGTLSLDDPVRKHLPEVPDFGTPITIRHMLNHTSGLRTFRPLVLLRGRPDGLTVHTNAEILALVSRQRELDFPTGEEYSYSNQGYILSVLLVERITGRSLQEFAKERIFGPLGMKDTRWRDDFTQVVRGRAAGYETGPSGAVHTNMPNTNIYGNGGLLTTVGDLQRWNRELDDPRSLGQAFVDMLEEQGRLNDGSVSHYALGLEVGEYHGVRQIAHSGGTAGYRAYLARYPDDERLSVALLCNDGDLNPGRVAHDVADVFLGDDEAAPQAKDPAPSISAEELTALAGPYLHTRTDTVALVSVKDGGLRVGRLEATALGDGHFRIEAWGLPLVFDRADNGSRRLRFAGDPKREYVAMPAATPGPAELAEYAGSYYSDELDVAYSIYVHRGKLVFHGRFKEPVTLEPLFADAFDFGDPVLERFPLRKRFARTVAWVGRFTRDEMGRVESLFISAGRVRRMRFDRQ